MPWRAIIESPPVQHGSRFTVPVIFFSATEKIEPQHIECDGTLADLTARCRNVAASLDKAGPATHSPLTAGIELDLTPPQPPVVDPPTPEQVAETKYRLDRSVLDRLLASQVAGMTVNPSTLDAQLAKTKAEYLSKYDGA